jgi:hypothetical protein
MAVDFSLSRTGWYATGHWLNCSAFCSMSAGEQVHIGTMEVQTHLRPEGKSEQWYCRWVSQHEHQLISFFFFLLLNIPLSEWIVLLGHPQVLKIMK